VRHDGLQKKKGGGGEGGDDMSSTQRMSLQVVFLSARPSPGERPSVRPRPSPSGAGPWAVGNPLEGCRPPGRCGGRGTGGPGATAGVVAASFPPHRHFPVRKTRKNSSKKYKPEKKNHAQGMFKREINRRWGLIAARAWARFY
jgi:hypothetical protein